MTDNKIDVVISQRSQQSIQKALESTAKFKEETKELIGLFRNLTQMLKGMETIGLVRNGNLGGLAAGAQARGVRKANSLTFDGSDLGKTAQLTKQRADQEKAILRSMEQQQLRAMALRQSHKNTKDTFTRIKDLQEAINLKAAIEERIRREAGRGAVERVEAFRKQSRWMDEHISKLKDEKRLTDQINRARTRNTELEQAQTERSRRLKMQGLFGDGGAALFSVQAGISANYLALNTLRQGVSQAITFSAGLDESLRNLQAITVTTDGDLARLKDSLIDISEQTKFTALEVADAAVTLGQAGLSIQEIEKAVPSVALLATATGTDLARAVDIATATLGVFQLESSQMAHVADTMTAAVNTSKLNIEKLTLGLQYSGNIAAQSGLRFEELTAALGAMANAGIRSGSTLGTGMRQVLTALQKPSKNFSETLTRLGLTMDDIDVSSQGLYGALSNLKEAGFTSADAIRGFEVRAAAAYNALSNNLDQVVGLEETFLSSAAAMKANETQMRAVNNQAKRLGSIFKSVLEVGMEPFVLLTRDLIKNFADFLEVLREKEGLLRGVTAGFVGLTAATVGFLTLRLGRGLLRMATAGLQLSGGLKLVSSGLSAAALSGLTFRTVMIGVRAAISAAFGPIGIIVAGVGTMISAWAAFNRENKNMRDELDKAQTQFDNSAGAAKSLADQITQIDNEIGSLESRYDRLTSDSRQLEAETQRVRQQFVDMGLDLETAEGGVDNLIEALQSLRSEIAEEYVVKLRIAGQDLQALQLQQQTNFDASRTNLRTASRNFGGGFTGQKSIKSNGRLKALTDGATAPGLSAVEINSKRVDIRDYVKELEAALEDGAISAVELNQLGFTLGRQGSLGKALQPLTNLAEWLKGMDSELADLARQAGSIEESSRKISANETRLAVAQDFTLPAVAKADSRLNRIRDFTLGSSFRGLNLGSKDVSAQAQLSQAQGAASNLQDELSAVRELIVRMQNLNPETVKEMLGRIKILEGEVAAKLVPYEAAAREELEELRELDLTRLKSRLSETTGQFKGSNDIGELLVEAVGIRQEIYARELESIAASGEGILIRQAMEEEAATRLQNDLNKIKKDAAGADNTSKRKAVQNQIQSMETTLATLQREQGNVESQDQNLGLDQMIGSLINQIHDLKLQEARLGDGDLESLRLALAEERDAAQERRREVTQARNQTILRVVEDELRDQMKIADRDAGFDDKLLAKQLMDAATEADVDRIQQERKQILEDLRNNLQDLLDGLVEAGIDVGADEYNQITDALLDGIEALNTETLNKKEALRQIAKEKNDEAEALTKDSLQEESNLAEKAFERALKLGEKAKTLAVRNAQLEAALVALDQQVAADTALAEIEHGDNPAALASALKSLDVLRANAMDEVSDARSLPLGKKTRGGGKSKTAEELYRRSLSNRIGATKVGVASGAISPLSGAADIQTALSGANSEVERLNARILGLQNVAQKGSLSNEGQEQLNRLLSDRTSLLNTIKTEEREISGILIENGEIMQGIPAIVQQWSDENLTLSQTLADGLTGALTSARGALSDFFVEWSNGTMSAGQAFRKMGTSIAKSIQKIIADLMAAYLLQKALGWAGVEVTGMPQISFGRPTQVAPAPGLASGGMVAGNSNRDTERYNLMPGEYVLRRSAVQAIGKDELDRINAMGNNLAEGGHVGAATKTQKGVGTPVNVWVVSPDQKPVPGPNDIIAVVADDMSKGGTTKKLVKQIQAGY